MDASIGTGAMFSQPSPMIHSLTDLKISPWHFCIPREDDKALFVRQVTVDVAVHQGLHKLSKVTLLLHADIFCTPRCCQKAVVATAGNARHAHRLQDRRNATAHL